MTVTDLILGSIVLIANLALIPSLTDVHVLVDSTRSIVSCVRFYIEKIVLFDMVST